MSQETPNAADNRSESRVPHTAEVSLRLIDETLSGVSDNLSSAGIMMVTADELRVSVEFQGPEGAFQRTGRLVRLQRMDAEHNGLAVEFDPE